MIIAQNIIKPQNTRRIEELEKLDLWSLEKPYSFPLTMNSTFYFPWATGPWTVVSYLHKHTILDRQLFTLTIMHNGKCRVMASMLTGRGSKHSTTIYRDHVWIKISDQGYSIFAWSQLNNSLTPLKKPQNTPLMSKPPAIEVNKPLCKLT